MLSRGDPTKPNATARDRAGNRWDTTLRCPNPSCRRWTRVSSKTAAKHGWPDTCWNCGTRMHHLMDA